MTSNMELPSLPTRDELQVTLLPRPHSARIESSAKQRPKPNRSQNHSKMANVTDENMAPNLEAHQLTLSSTSECPLRRTAEIPLTKPTRSMSMGGEGTRPAAHFEDDFVLKLPTLALQAPASIAGHQVRTVHGPFKHATRPRRLSQREQTKLDRIFFCPFQVFHKRSDAPKATPAPPRDSLPALHALFALRSANT